MNKNHNIRRNERNAWVKIIPFMRKRGWNLYSANIEGAYFDGIDMRDMHMSLVNAKGASFMNCNMEKMNMFMGDFAGATFMNVDLSNAHMTKAEMTMCKMYNVILDKVEAPLASFRLSLIKNCDFSHSYLSGANFEGCEMTESIFNGARMENTNLYLVSLDEIFYDSIKDGTIINYPYGMSTIQNIPSLIVGEDWWRIGCIDASTDKMINKIVYEKRVKDKNVKASIAYLCYMLAISVFWGEKINTKIIIDKLQTEMELWLKENRFKG